MATIKAFSDLQQSKVLAGILPLESADMEWINSDGLGEPFPFVGRTNDEEGLPCWSLAALLNAIPYTIYKSDNEFYRLGIDKGYDDYAVWYNNNGFTITDLDVASDNFVDACVVMIEKLHKLKIL